MEGPHEQSQPGMADLDRPLNAIGFRYDIISPEKITGRLPVTERCCQPFQVLHGGVSAMVAEGMASMGAYVSSGFGRIAGAQLSINHIRPAALGDSVEAEALPVHLGRTIQVWEVKLWKVADSSTDPRKRRALVSTSTVTLTCGRQPQGNGSDYAQVVKKFAKL